MSQTTILAIGYLSYKLLRVGDHNTLIRDVDADVDRRTQK